MSAPADDNSPPASGAGGTDAAASGAAPESFYHRAEHILPISTFFRPDAFTHLEPRLTLTDAPTAPTKERRVPSLPVVPSLSLSPDILWAEDGLPNTEALREHFLVEGRLRLEDAMRIITSVGAQFRSEETLLSIPAPITICGDIHGQYYDLVKLFSVGGKPGEVQYLFLGDYVDRGCFSCECVLYLFSLKLRHPDMMWFLRGNHESRHMTEHFNFKLECTRKYSSEFYEACITTFDALPLAAVVEKQFLCVHGGLSPDITSLEDIRMIDRFSEPPPEGPMCDLLWSDPMQDYDTNDQEERYTPNVTRLCSYYYSFKIVCSFLDYNSLLSVIRGHEACDQGYQMMRAHPETDFPSLITIFSAPNYADVYNNMAAFMHYSSETMNIRQFRWSPHPYWLPSFMNAFTWSLPFVAERIVDIFATMFSLYKDEDFEQMGATPSAHQFAQLVGVRTGPGGPKDGEQAAAAGPLDIAVPPPAAAASADPDVALEGQQLDAAGLAATRQAAPPEALAQLRAAKRDLFIRQTGESTGDAAMRSARAQRLRAKVQMVGRLRRMLRTLRENRESVLQIKEHSGDAMLPQGLLVSGTGTLKEHAARFVLAAQQDRHNEEAPTSIRPASLAGKAARGMPEALAHPHEHPASVPVLPRVAAGAVHPRIQVADVMGQHTTERTPTVGLISSASDPDLMAALKRSRAGRSRGKAPSTRTSAHASPSMGRPAA